MNKVQLMFEHSKWLQNAIPHYAPLALRLNEQVENLDFVNFKRTGPCGVLVNKKNVTIGCHHVPEGVSDPKFRYSRNTSNKLVFLLENPTRKSTKPMDQDEKILLENLSIWRGGILLPDGTRITTSGFHPLIDEAMDIHIGLVMTGMTDLKEREKWLKNMAKEFENPYALCLSSMANYISHVNPDDALDWGLEQIPKQEF